MKPDQVTNLMRIFQHLKSSMCYLRSRITASMAVILLVAVSVIWTNFNNHLWKEKHGVVIHDVVGYYSYLPAAIIQHDLRFDFIIKYPEDYFGHIIRLRTPDGGVYQKMTMGLAFLYLPFFLIGHAEALLTGVKATGFTEPYMFWLVFSAMFYGVAGLLLLRKILLKFFSDRLTAFVLLMIAVGTNLYFYLTLEAPMSHAYNFFLFVLFVWLSMRWHSRPSFKNSVFTGLTYGLIGLIRPTNGLIVIFFMLYDIHTMDQLKLRFGFFLHHWKQIVLIIIMAFIVVFPQLLFWKTNTGSWIFYSYGEEGFFFNNPQIWRGLFSYRKGWLLYTPLMIFGLAGIFSLKKHAPAFFIPVLVFVPINIYVIFSWWDWSYGGSYGSRPMIDSYGLMAVSMGALITEAFRRKKALAYTLQVIMVMMLLFNIFQMLQYKYATLHYAFMTKEAYWHAFGKLKADAEFYDKLESMDYNALRKGIYKTRPTARITIGPDAVNDFETLTPDGKKMQSPDEHYRFNHFDNRSQLEARSGSWSALLTPEKAFCSGIDFPVKPGQKYAVSVWKKPASESGSLVFSSGDSKTIYEPRNVVDSTDANGWGRISFEFTIPDDYYNWCRVYVWNKGQDSVYFDDLLIRKLN